MKHDRTRTNKTCTRRKAYFKLTDTLPERQFLRQAIVVPLYHGKVLMLKPHGNRLQFPRCSIEDGEPLYKTVRRKLHKETGAHTQHSFLLGQFSVYSCTNHGFYIPVYVSKVSHLEKKVSGRIGFAKVENAVKQFAPYWEKPNLDCFTRTLLKHAARLEQNKNRLQQKHKQPKGINMSRDSKSA